jgi:ribosomal protein L7Ae-like RNA K-turn-binding protein
MKEVLRSLGLARRAGALVCGTPMICTALGSNKKPLIVVAANDISEGTRKKLTDKCAFYETPLLTVDASGETLATAVSKSGFLAAVAVADENLAKLVNKGFDKAKTMNFQESN